MCGGTANKKKKMEISKLLVFLFPNYTVPLPLGISFCAIVVVLHRYFPLFAFLCLCEWCNSIARKSNVIVIPDANSFFSNFVFFFCHAFASLFYDALSLSVRSLCCSLCIFLVNHRNFVVASNVIFHDFFFSTVNFRIYNCFTSERFAARYYFIPFDVETRWNRNWSDDGNNDGVFSEQWIICHRKWLNPQETKNIDATWKVFSNFHQHGCTNLLQYLLTFQYVRMTNVCEFVRFN